MITILNRPTQAGIYHLTYHLTGSNLTFEQVAALIKQQGSKDAFSADKNALIGLWRQTQAGRQDAYYGTKPQRPLSAYLSTAFDLGASLAYIPPGYTYVEKVFASYVLLSNLETPANWTPEQTVIDQYGQPISETNTAGQAVQLATIPQQGIGQVLAELYGAEEPDLYGYNGSQYPLDPTQAQAPLQGEEASWRGAYELIKPALQRAIGFVGKVIAYYVLARGLIYYIKQITFNKIDELGDDLRQAIEGATSGISEAGSGLLLPLVIGAGILLASSAS